eukprot:Skav232008  [mRNA]  locus=scaffold719:758090:761435:- [translate_table: standard]
MLLTRRVLCSVDDEHAALMEIYRVLKPGSHVQPPVTSIIGKPTHGSCEWTIPDKEATADQRQIILATALQSHLKRAEHQLFELELQKQSMVSVVGIGQGVFMIPWQQHIPEYPCSSLVPAQEPQVLRALRDCCGILQDLSEVAATFLVRGNPIAEPEEPKPDEDPTAAGSQETEKATAGSKVEKAKKETGAKRDKIKKDLKQGKKKRRSKSKEQEGTRPEATVEEKEPATSSGKEKKGKEIEEEAEEEEFSEESEKEDKTAEEVPAPPSERVRRQREEQAVARVSFVKEWEAANPQGLSQLPARRSRGPSAEQTHQPSGRDPPPEPDHSPRRHESSTRARGRRERSRSRRRYKNPRQQQRERDRAKKWREELLPQEQWRRRQRRVLHRPARRGGDRVDDAAFPGDSLEERWKRFEELPSHQVDLRWLSQGEKLVITKGYYYGEETQLAGDWEGAEVVGADVRFRLTLTGTLNDKLLTWGSSQNKPQVRAHLCGVGCNREEVADSLVHCATMRKAQGPDVEEGWTTNLVVPLGPPRDDLAVLRRRGEDREDALPERRKKEKAEEVSSSEGKKRGKKKEKKKGKESKRKKKEKAAKSSGEHEEEKAKKEKDRKTEDKKKKKEEESSDESSVTAGRNPRVANKKEASTLFAGTGLDVSEKVRRRVFRRARRHLKKKDRSSSSSSEGSSDSSGLGGQEMEGEGIFQEASKVRRVGELYPGALGAQALMTMRAQLLTEVGLENNRHGLRGIGVPYFRQHLTRRSSGPQQRELLTLLSAVDGLMAGRVASTVDLLLQRVKSCQAMLEGSHWSVAQRLELLVPENQMVVPMPELSSARKDVYEEAKVRNSAAGVEGKPSYGKGAAKKGEEPRKGSGKDKRPGKGQGSKSDPGKKGPESRGST